MDTVLYWKTNSRSHVKDDSDASRKQAGMRKKKGMAIEYSKKLLAHNRLVLKMYFRLLETSSVESPSVTNKSKGENMYLKLVMWLQNSISKL